MTAAPASGSGRIWHLPQPDALVAVAHRLTLVPRLTVRRTLHRAMYARYLDASSGVTPDPLYCRGSLAGRRYTPRLGPAGLYLSFDPSTPPAELKAVVFEHGFPAATEEHDPIILIAVRAVVHRVLDLTDASTCTTLDLSDDDLGLDWEQAQEEYLARRAPMPATQMLALAAHSTELFAGIKYPSVRTDFGINLVVFPDRLRAEHGDALEVIDSTGRYAQRVPA